MGAGRRSASRLRSDGMIKPSAAWRSRAQRCRFDECLIVSGEISDISGADETKSGSLAKDGGESCREEVLGWVRNNQGRAGRRTFIILGNEKLSLARRRGGLKKGCVASHENQMRSECRSNTFVAPVGGSHLILIPIIPSL